jgi:hypothetical protein
MKANRNASRSREMIGPHIPTQGYALNLPEMTEWIRIGDDITAMRREFESTVLAPAPKVLA